MRPCGVTVSIPRTLSEAQDQLAQVCTFFRVADQLDDLEELANEIRGLQRLIQWMRVHGENPQVELNEV